MRTILVLALLVLIAAPAAAQRERTRTPTKSTTARTSSKAPTALEKATRMRRASEPAGTVARVLRSEYRLGVSSISSTMVRAGYGAEDVVTSVVTALRVSPDRAAPGLRKGGIRAEAVYRGFRRARIGIAPTFQAVRVAYGFDGLAALLVEEKEDACAAPDAMGEAGMELPEIVRTLRDTCGWTEQQIVEWMVERGYSPAPIGETMASELGMTIQDAMNVLSIVGTTIGIIVGILLAILTFGAGAGLVSAAVTVVGTLIGAGFGAADIAPALLEAGLTQEEVVEVMGEAAEDGAIGAATAAEAIGLSLSSTAPILVEDGYDPLAIMEALRQAYDATWAEVTAALQAAGVSPDAIVESMLQAGLSPDQITQILLDLGYGLSQIAAWLAGAGA